MPVSAALRFVFLLLQRYAYMIDVIARLTKHDAEKDCPCSIFTVSIVLQHDSIHHNCLSSKTCQYDLALCFSTTLLVLSTTDCSLARYSVESIIISSCEKK